MTKAEQAITIERIKNVLAKIGDTSDLNEAEKEIEEIVINIVPENYPENPQEAKGYCWSNFATKEAGIDIAKEEWEEAAASLIKEKNAKKAWVNCMWSGGYIGVYPKA